MINCDESLNTERDGGGGARTHCQRSNITLLRMLKFDVKMILYTVSLKIYRR